MEQLLEKLVKKFPALYGTRKFVTSFTKIPGPVPILSQVNSVHVLHPTSWRSILILRCHLCLRLPRCLLPSDLHTNTLHAPLLCVICATCPTHLVFLDLIIQIIFSEEYNSQISPLCCLLHSCYFVRFGTIYPPKHPILLHPQSTILHQCQRPSFTHTT